MQTVEAIIDKAGKVRLLSEVELPASRRALLTILDEEPKITNSSNREELLRAVKRAQKANVFKEIDDPVEWQKKLRDEWD